MTQAERVQPTPPLILPPTLRNGRRVRWCGACRVLYSQGSHVGHKPMAVSERCCAWMPNVREFCARTQGHLWEHRSQYALDNKASAKHRYRSEMAS